MLSEISQLQNNAVTKLEKIVLNCLSGKKASIENRTFTFKAPTGSGKTYMMADFCSRILQKRKNCIFLISSLSKGSLAKQNFDKFEEYRERGYFVNLDNYLIQSVDSGEGKQFIPLDKNIYFLPRDLYKAKSNLYKEKTLGSFINTITKDNISLYANTSQSVGKEIIFIRDESHNATNNLEKDFFKYFSSIINFSATPDAKKGQIADVEITTGEAENTKLIKRVEVHSESESLEDALKLFKEVKNKYAENKLNINPCMIIQIDNKDKGGDEWKSIKRILTNHPELKYLKIVNDDKECETNDRGQNMPISKWKETCKGQLSPIDIIVFKLCITEGWDIPRACMLYQVRDAKSQTLNEQVIGRVRRNPCLLNFEILSSCAQELVLTAHIWGVVPETHEKYCDIVPRIKKNIIKFETTHIDTQESLKTGFNADEFLENKEMLNTNSIFQDYRNLKKKTDETKQVVWDYSLDFEKYFKIIPFADEIQRKIETIAQDYEKTLKVDEVKADLSYKTNIVISDSNYTRAIDNWMWQRKDKDDEYPFDSEAEKKFAKILNKLSGKFKTIDEAENELSESDKISLWGKNFLSNSPIKYEYYNAGVHRSYPDFIIVDKNDKVHIIEVKSVNKSSSENTDDKAYKDKVLALEKCYLETSKIANNVFYLAIMNGDDFEFRCFENGDEKTISQCEFEAQF